MKYLKKYESPDQIKYQGDGYKKTLHWMNDDAIAFGYTNGIIKKFIVCSPSESHGDCGFDRHSMNYAGRLWLEEQVISFWEYPDPKTFENIINSLESHLDISMQPDDFWGEWQVEILLVDNKIIRDKIYSSWEYVDEYDDSILIPMSQYANYYNGIQKVNKDIDIEHTKSPLIKQNKKSIFGSKKGNIKKPIEWRNALGKFRGENHSYIKECHFPELFEMKSEELKNYDNFQHLINEYDGDEQRANKEWNWFFNQLVNLNSGGYIYRLVFLKNIGDLNENDLGEHWTLTEENAKELEDTLKNQFFPEDSDIDDYETYIIEAKTKPDNIDFENSMYAFCKFPWEQEVNIKNLSKLELKSIEKL